MINMDFTGHGFEISKEELNKADDYSVEDYERVYAGMSSDNVAWAYRTTLKLNSITLGFCLTDRQILMLLFFYKLIEVYYI